MSEFVLDNRLKSDTVEVCNLRLSTVRLMNDSRYPWVVLVPKVSGAEELHDLSDADYESLNFEIRKVSLALSKEFNPYKINTGALGNIVRQLHIHVIVRFEDDFAWPGPVWGVGKPVPYEEAELNDIVKKIREVLK